MSNNTPDYNDNLVFAPTCANNAQVQLVPPASDIKELKDEIEFLKTQLRVLEQTCGDTLSEKDKEIATLKEQLSEHKDNCCCQKNEVLLLKIDKLEKQLEIAKRGFESIVNDWENNTEGLEDFYYSVAVESLRKIKELEK